MQTPPRYGRVTAPAAPPLTDAQFLAQVARDAGATPQAAQAVLRALAAVSNAQLRGDRSVRLPGLGVLANSVWYDRGNQRRLAFLPDDEQLRRDLARAAAREAQRAQRAERAALAGGEAARQAEYAAWVASVRQQLQQPQPQPTRARRGKGPART